MKAPKEHAPHGAPKGAGTKHSPPEPKTPPAASSKHEAKVAAPGAPAGHAKTPKLEPHLPKAKKTAGEVVSLVSGAVSTPAPPPGPASPPSATPSAPAPAPAVAASTSTPTATTPPSPAPASPNHRRHAAARTSARSARQRASAPVLLLGAIPLGTSPTTLPAAGGESAGGPSHAGDPAGGRARKTTRESLPAIRTIERLVGVIPGWIWSAIGVLAVLTLVLGGGSLTAVARARRVERQRRRLAADVGLLAGALLPAVPERIGPAAPSAAYRPAEGPAAGGDFYDVFELEDGRLALMVGDVSGHGRAALPQTALIRYTLRAYLDAGMAPREALAAGAAALERQLQASFATVVLAIYDPGTRALTYSCAGHPPPVVLGTRPLEPVLECCSPPIGMGSPTGLRETTVSVPGRAQVCFFTDGVIEARTEGELFGVERLTLALEELGAETSAQQLLDEVVARSDRRPDDMAACLLSLPGGEREPALHSEELELLDGHTDWQAPQRFLEACGLDPHAIHEAVLQARATVARTGGAILRVRLDGPFPAASVAPADVSLASGHGSSGAEHTLAGTYVRTPAA